MVRPFRLGQYELFELDLESLNLQLNKITKLFQLNQLELNQDEINLSQISQSPTLSYSYSLPCSLPSPF